jgi:hypothetical protein
MIYFYIILVCVFNTAHALSASPACQVPVINGHLHLTSVSNKNTVRSCEFHIEGPETFIEIERYGGRRADEDAWMNFTLEGEPPVEVAIGMHTVWAGDTHAFVPTTTRLEFSMWLHIISIDNTLTVRFAPPGSSNFGQVFRGTQMFTEGRVVVRASTKTGMEQVVQNIQSKQPDFDSPLHRKSIVALEKRVTALENEIDKMHKRDDRQDELHSRHNRHHHKKFDSVKKLHLLTKEQTQDMQNQLGGVQYSVTKWAAMTVCILLVVVYVSWRMYQRHKKEKRWTL